MALSATISYEVQTGGNDSNSGGFNAQGASAGTDRTQQTSPHVTIDGVTISAVVHTTTTQITLTGYTVSAADIRNTLRITAGTATAGLYEITAVDVPNNRWTVDRSAGAAAATVQGRMGGCLLSPAIACSHVNGTGGIIWVKSGTYTISSSSSNVANGRCTLGGGGAQRAHMEGYQTTRGDRAAKPVLQTTTNTMTVVTGNTLATFVCIEVDKASATGINGFSGGASDVFIECVARPTTGSTQSGFNGGIFIKCQAYGGFINFNSIGYALACYSSAGTTAFSGSGPQCYGCVADAPTTEAFRTNGTGIFVNCVAYNCTSGTGFNTGTGGIIVNCIAYQASGTMTTAFTGSRNFLLQNCAYGGTITTTNGNSNTFDAPSPALISLSGNPFTDPANKDFTLNNTAGAGALLRAAGFPATMTWMPGTNYVDIGAFQVQSTSSSSPSTSNTVIGGGGISQ